MSLVLLVATTAAVLAAPPVREVQAREVRARVVDRIPASTEETLLFKFHQSEQKTKDGFKLVSIHFNPDGSEAMREEATVKGDVPVVYRYWQKQLGEHGEVVVKDGKVHFSYTTPKGTNKAVEEWTPNYVIGPTLFRFAENRRKRPPEGSPVFVPYASCYIAMLMGRYLLEDLKAKLEELDHRNFAAAKALIETKLEVYYAKALPAIHDALVALYNEKEISLQRLSATFRREDLIEFLNVGPQSPGLLGPNPELSLSDAPPPAQS